MPYSLFKKNTMNNTAYIVDVLRTPRGRGKKNSALEEVKPLKLLLPVLKSLQNKHGFDHEIVEDIIIGCATPIGEQGSNLGKSLALYAKWSDSICGMQVNRFCASGLESINIAAAKINANHEACIIAGGVESLSRVPMGNDGGALHFDPEVSSTINFIPQGISADLIASLEGYSRTELDEYALSSHIRGAEAQSKGYFKDSIVPILDQNNLPILLEDETIRQTNIEALSALMPSFEELGKRGYDTVALRKYPNLERVQHLHTAGNSSQLADGGALALICNEATLKAYNLVPKAKVLGTAICSVNTTIMLTGTIPSVEKLLKKLNLDINDIDLWEVNEAFAASVLKFQKHFNIPHHKLNVNGGVIGLGHPLGATGTIVTGMLIDELQRQGKKRGIVAICTGAGMGIATAIEIV